MLKIYKNDILDIQSVLLYTKKEEMIKSDSIYFLSHKGSRCKSGVLCISIVYRGRRIFTGVYNVYSLP